MSTTVTATATTPKGKSFTFPEASATLEISAAPAGSTTTAIAGDVDSADDVLHVKATVRNDGNVTLTDPSVTIGGEAVECDVDTLAPGETTGCSIDHIVTQAQFDAGRLDFHTTGTATTPAGESTTLTASDASVEFERTGAISAALTPKVKDDVLPGVGDPIGLALSVHNDGNVSVHDVAAAVEDEEGIEVSCPQAPLAPGATVACDVHGQHEVTQADVDRGSVAFSAPVTAADTTDTALSTTATATQATEAAAPALSSTLEPTLAAGSRPDAGDEIALVLHVTNDGNVTLSDVAGSLSDPEGLTADCSEAPLAPGASTDCAVTGYVVTQDDVDAGERAFTADVEAQDPHGKAVRAHDDASVVLDRHAGVTATATAERDGQEAPRAGDPVRVTVTVRNGGNVTLRDVAGTVGRDDVTCPHEALAPGDEVTCTIADHELTQAEVDHGEAVFEAEVTAKGPGGSTAEGSDTAALALARVPAITAESAAVLDADEHEVPLAGDTVSLSMTVTNTGNTTVDHVDGVVTDRRGVDVTCPTDALAPGDSTACEVSRYTLRQKDVDAGSVAFDLTGAARGTNGARVEAAAPQTVVSIVRAPAITAQVTAALDGDEDEPTAGDGVTLHLTVRNTGNVTVRDVSGAVAHHDGLAARCSAEPLAPGKTVDCTFAPYRVTQHDIDAGKVAFDVTAAAVGADGRHVEAGGRAGIVLAQHARIDATLSAHLGDTEHEVPAAGDHIRSVLTLTNTGNVTLTEPTAEVVELADATVSCPQGGIAPGDSVECAVPDHVLTQSEVDHGVVEIVVTAEATGADGTRPADRDSVRVGLDAASGLDMTAAALVSVAGGAERPARGTDVLHPGDRVRIRYTVVNTGNLQVRDLQHAADLPAVTCDDGDLDPGQRTTCTTEEAHTVTDAEAADGEVVLQGRVMGQVRRENGASVETPGAASTGQSGDAGRAEGAAVTTATTAARTAPTVTIGDPAERPVASAAAPSRPVWVFSEKVRTVLPTAPAPAELAFTGTDVLATAVPAAVVLLLGGLVLLLTVRRRREESRHRA
ncbi:hypothetical protein [Curtobacterium sp. MCBD17_032]|uniref:DUF7507 domain-containing protein n=1 Tax=Curtobacterium sp. MCBD17_032 TaxID=2175659 RepID=UPI0011B6220A|nr:hypothetical protein [Curtobacterium sp. MCBD17_032]